MTQEEKQLLLQDLCAREPYHPRIRVFKDGHEGFVSDLWLFYIEAFRHDEIEIRPYLRPLSSMTEDEFKELKSATDLNYDQLELVSWPDGSATLEFYLEEVPQYCVINVFNWLNAHHFDHSGLITMGLALEAPDGMYKID